MNNHSAKHSLQLCAGCWYNVCIVVTLAANTMGISELMVQGLTIATSHPTEELRAPSLRSFIYGSKRNLWLIYLWF